MWLRIRSGFFLFTSLVVFLGVAGSLGWLLVGTLAALTGVTPEGSIVMRIVVALTVAGLGGSALLLIQIAAHVQSQRRIETRDAEIARWSEIWVGALLGEPLPEPAHGDAPADALALGRETVEGVTAQAYETLYARTGLLDADVLAARRGRGLRRSGAIERMAMMRHPATLQPLTRLAAHRDAIIAAAARRAAVRVLAGGAFPEDDAIDAGTRLLGDPRVSAGEATELLLLLGDARSPLLVQVLDPNADHALTLRVAALEAVASGGGVDLALLDAASAWVRHSDPEVRASALRALRVNEYVPDGEEDAVLGALDDRLPAVRMHAAGACVALPWERIERPLTKALGDPDRWVRHAAAQAMLASGPHGRDALIAAIGTHEDRFARDTAAEVLAWT